ncbi:MAG: Holliday junction resolvase RuvX [Gemmataceae bacterium]
MRERTRLLGVDYGTVRIGLAITDPDRILASPLETYTRRDKEADADHFRELVEEERVGEIVMGLPVHLSGRKGQKAIETEDFAKELEAITGLKVTFYDERFTTVEAEQFLLDAGLTNKRRKARRDQLAAQILLQSYLDAGCPSDPEIGPLDG